jgi:hypothetical protein
MEPKDQKEHGASGASSHSNMDPEAAQAAQDARAVAECKHSRSPLLVVGDWLLARCDNEQGQGRPSLEPP